MLCFLKIRTYPLGWLALTRRCMRWWVVWLQMWCQRNSRTWESLLISFWWPRFESGSAEWLVSHLRSMAKEMEPLLQVSTILQWTIALMPLVGNPEYSTRVQICRVNEITSGFIHALDDSLLGSKRSHNSEPEDVVVSKRHRKSILNHNWLLLILS